MKSVRAIYRREADGAWIGTSPEVPGYVAHGDTYEQARDRMQEGLPWFAERDLLIAHMRVPVESATSGPKVSFAISRATSDSSYRVLSFAESE
jgi:predicted RNase H-like HicB family nuclease